MNGVCTKYTLNSKRTIRVFGRLIFLILSFFIPLILNNNNTTCTTYTFYQKILFCVRTTNAATAYIDRYIYIKHSQSFVYQNTQTLCCFPFVLKFNQPIFMCIFCGRINA